MPTVYSPPVSTYVPLATITLASTDSEVVFSSIPATYRDLIVVCSVRNSGTTDGFLGLRFNGDTATNITNVWMFGRNSSTDSAANTDSLTLGMQLNETGNSFDTHIYNIMDYSATDKHKTILARSHAGTAELRMGAARWADTSAINEIKISLNTGTLSSGSIFSLYGIEA